MIEFQIRPALISDAKGIARVHVKSWQFAYKHIIDQQALAALEIEDRAKRWEEIIADDTETNWIAEIPSDTISPSQIIGFASLGLSRDADLENFIELYALYLDPTYFGRKIGYSLINHVLGHSPASLWVFEGNERAYQFYLRQGFQPDGIKGLHNFQGKDYPKLRMRRD